MGVYNLYTDKNTNFECKIQLQGAALSNSQARIVLESNNHSLLYKGNVDKFGKCNIEIPKLKGLLENGSSGKMMLEVIADDAFFQPWETKFSVDASRKVTVEVATPKQKSPKIRVDVNTPYKKLKSTIVNELHNKNITSRNALKRKAVIISCINENVTKSGLGLDPIKVMKEVIKLL